MKRSRLVIFAMLASLALLPTANAQTNSGTVTGTVTDSSGGAIPNVTVQATADLTKQQFQFKTGNNGDFQFQITPGDYTIHIAQTGFKAYDQKITLAPQERYDMHDIKLTVGDVTSTIEVTGEIAHVQTDSSDRSVTINQTQIEDTPSAGRNYLNILRSLPGTAQTTTTDGRGGTGANGGGGAPTVNGGAGQMLVTLDGIASQDSGAPGTGGYIAPSVDAIGEVQVMVSNYTSEYGARNGGQMNVTIKNGTAQYHGSAYEYYRHEEFNSNEWFNNKNTVSINGIPGQANPKPLYRYSNPGGTIGGPLYIPGKFNRNKNKLFFFFSEDYLHHTGTNGPNRYTMPTQAERNGDYSATVTSTGVLIPIKNSLNGGAQFTNNQIPLSQMSNQGYAILNLFPNPNAVDPSGARGYNYVDSFTNSSPAEDRILRLDSPIGKKTQAYIRLLQDYYATMGAGSLLQSGGAGWGQFLSTYGVPSASFAVNVIHTFRPNLINEFTGGINRSHQIVQANDPTSTCSATAGSLATGTALPYSCSQLSNPNIKGIDGKLVTFPNFFPGANTLNLIPNVSFGTGGGFSQQSGGPGVTGSAPTFSVDSRWPFSGTDQISSITDNLTWIKGSHTIKGGFYFEYDSRNVSMYNNFNTQGTYYFASDTANSNDAGYPFANASTGAAFAYGTDNKRQVNHSRYSTYEGFIQDTWKVNRRLTLDIGLRVQSIGQEESKGASLGFFQTSLFNAKTVGQLLSPALVNGKKVAENLNTGAIYPYAQVNTFDPASYAAGSFPWSGIQTYNTAFWNRGRPNLGPRVGFAYDALGNGKLAIRGGFGIFYGRATSVDQIAANGAGNGPQEVAPNFLSPAYVYPTLGTTTTTGSLANSQAYFGPQAVYGGTQNILNPQTIQWSFGVQRDIGKGVIMDVSYLGWVTHHNFNQTGYDYNSIPLLTEWKPTPDSTTNSCGQVLKYLDPTNNNVNATTCTGGAFLNANLLRPYAGWTNIYVSQNLGEVNYNALQVQINKRFGKRLQFGTNYNWSKQLQYNHNQFLPDRLTYNVNSSNRPQVVNVNFGYKLPNGSRITGKNFLTQAAFDGWNVNGVMSFFDGQPLTVGCGIQSGPIGYWTGQTVSNAPGVRCQMTGNVWLAQGATPASVGSTIDPRLWYPLNAGPSLANNVSGFVLPAANTLGQGNTPPTLFYGPGFENADISMSKEFTLGKETRVLAFRAETFNLLNHFNPGNPNTSLTYNYGTGAQTNANFGAITGVNGNARRMALSLRLRF